MGVQLDTTTKVKSRITGEFMCNIALNSICDHIFDTAQVSIIKNKKWKSNLKSELDTYLLWSNSKQQIKEWTDFYS